MLRYFDLVPDFSEFFGFVNNTLLFCEHSSLDFLHMRHLFCMRLDSFLPNKNSLGLFHDHILTLSDRGQDFL